jgi:hypothetical protein
MNGIFWALKAHLRRSRQADPGFDRSGGMIGLNAKTLGDYVVSTTMSR